MEKIIKKWELMFDLLGLDWARTDDPDFAWEIRVVASTW